MCELEETTIFTTNQRELESRHNAKDFLQEVLCVCVRLHVCVCEQCESFSMISDYSFWVTCSFQVSCVRVTVSCPAKNMYANSSHFDIIKNYIAIVFSIFMLTS